MKDEVTISQYISVGYNCDPRIYIKNILNLSKSNGYNTCPFDLCITPFESLCKCIETDFQYFFDDLRLIPWGCAEGRDKNDLENKNAIINYYNIIFNHEGSGHSHLFNTQKNDDLFYIRNNFEKFKERYSLRINNFKKYINDYNNIIFIIKFDSDNNNNEYNLITLQNLFEKKYKNKNITITKI
jgi:hypothetical protein